MAQDINTDMDNNEEFTWRISILSWGIIAAISVSLLYVFQGSIDFLLHQWKREEYSHAYLIPAICAFFVWQKKNLLEKIEFNGSWLAIVVTIAGFSIYMLGVLSAVNSIKQYAIVMVILAMVWAYLGGKAFKYVAVPFLILFFMVPLPGFLFETLSGQLQLISSQIGVAFIRLFGISVYLEGNVIDLGVYQLQVVEACSGLRYLFPLLTLSFIAAYMYHERLWKRVVVFLSAIPVTVLMNSFRIGAIGVLVEHWGISMAEGFLHDFEGWIIFMACTAVLVLEMWLLAKISTEKRPFVEVFGLDFPEPTNEELPVKKRKNSNQFYAVVSLVVVAALLFSFFPERDDVIPQRKTFAEFPLELDDRIANKVVMEKIYTDSLDFDDYLLANYSKQDDSTDYVNLYIAYYDVQRADKVPHSPKACIPGGGWEITSMTNKRVDDIKISNVPLDVNRLIIQKGEIKQLVYYWFQQRGRIITSEYLMKWYLFSDAMSMNRSDGSLMRLSTTLKSGEDIKIADNRLELFAKEISPIIHQYVPQ